MFNIFVLDMITPEYPPSNEMMAISQLNMHSYVLQSLLFFGIDSSYLPLKVLTRRAQLQMKEMNQQRENKEEPPKTTEETAKKEEKQEEKKEDQQDKPDEEGKPEKPEEPVPKVIPNAKTKASAKAKPKAKATGRGRGRGRGRGQKSEVADVQTPDQPTTFGEKSGDEESIPTPKKRLFPDGAEEPEPKKASPVPAKPPSEVDPSKVDQIQEALLPKKIRNARKQLAHTEAKESGASSSGKGRGKGGGKRTKKSPNVKQVVKSPAVQKEKKRRARKGQPKEENIDLIESMEDQLLQGVFVQQLKPVDVLTYDDLKAHLIKADSDFTRSTLSVYWGRAACGVKWIADPKGSQVAYFAFKSTESMGMNYNHIMTLAFSAGMVLVSFQQFVYNVREMCLNKPNDDLIPTV